MKVQAISKRDLAKMKKLLKWQQYIVDKVSKMSNENLFNYILEVSTGDSWDGCFTDRGCWEFYYIIDQYKERLGYKIGL